jgi:hypothetical protein
MRQVSTGFGWEGKNHFEDLGVDARIILKWIVKTWDGDVDWINLGQDKDRYWAVVNTAVNVGEWGEFVE